MIKNLDYKLIGKGKTAVVFLHGWGLDKTYFDCIINKLEGDQLILSLDFFGFGKSKNPEKYFDTYEYAYHIFTIIKKLKIESVILVGHSFGGRISVILSSIFNIKIKGLFLISSAGINKFNLIKFLKIKFYKIIKIFVKKGYLKPDILLNFGSEDYKNLNDNIKNNFVKIVNQDLKFLLNKIESITYLIWDKKDKITPYKLCKIFNKNIRKSTIYLLKNGGHFSYLYNSFECSFLLNSFMSQS